jgi:hypothetical protein
MRPRTLLLFALAVLAGAAVAVLPALAAAPSEVKLEVNENCVEPNWPCWATPGSGSNPSPASKITITAGGEVKFADNTNTKTNIAWMGTAPACTSSVPVSPTPPQAPWEGTCKFEQPGTYKFESSTLFNGGPSLNYTEYEIVVEGASTGTTTAATTSPPGGGATTTSPTISPGGSGSGQRTGSPLTGSSSKAIKLAKTQHGKSVHGSIQVSQAGAGARLEVDLLASRASLAKAGHPAQVRVGRLVRPSLKVGSVSFAVPLNAKGQTSLRRHRRLALTVKITFTPVHGAAVTVTRSVVVHA